MKNELVSVIMNCYNAEEYLKEALNSLFSQTYDNFELVFVDNCSTDNSVKILSSYGHERIRLFRIDKHVCLGSARQFGIERAAGEYVAFLDCDDRYLPNKLERQVHYLRLNKSLSMCYSSAYIIDGAGIRNGVYYVPEASGNQFPAQLARYRINFQSVLIRAECLKKFNIKFDSNLTYSPDYDLVMSLVANTQVGSLSDCLVEYRRTRTSLSSRSEKVAPFEITHTLQKLQRLYPNAVEGAPLYFYWAFQKVNIYNFINSLKFEGRLGAFRLLCKLRMNFILKVCLALILPIPIKREAILRFLGR